LGDSEEMNKIIDFLNNLECHCNKKHPLLSQFFLNLFVGVLLIKIGLWVAGPKPKGNAIPTSLSSSEVTISNTGILPATTGFTISSPNSAISIQDVKEGKDYITVEPTTNEKVQYLSITNLPMGKTIKLNIEGSGSVKVKETSWGKR
jgi:hypothetical protein